MIFQECFVGGDVGHYDPQQIICVPRHQITFHHLGPLGDDAFECFQRGFYLALERNLYKHTK